MSISNITISQDNKISSSNLVPIHSPVVFVADVTYSGVAPDEIYVKLYDSNSILVDTFRAVWLRNLTSTVRQFAFVANDIIKYLMSDFSDIYQLSETFIEIPEMSEIYTIRFYDPDTPATYDEVLINFAHGAKQFSENPNLTDIYNNVETVFYGAEGSFAYVYYYNTIASSTISITDNAINKGAFLATNVGYYRYKTNINVAEKTINFDNTVTNYDQIVKELPACPDNLILKFLDNNGFYRFLTFNKYYEISEKRKLIGKTNEFLTTIATDGANFQSIGYATDRFYNVLAEDITTDLLEIIKDIYSSPRVYLQIGSGDSSAYWIQVLIQDADDVIKRNKRNSDSLNFTLQLPEHYTVKMI